MKRSIHHIIVLLLLPIVLAAQSAPAVKGIVRSAEDGMPIAGASVVVTRTMIGTATDADGRFEIRSVPEGRRTLTITSLGHHPAVVPFTGEEGEEVTVLLQPSPVQSQTVVVTATRREQSLEEVPVSMNIIGAQEFERRNTVALDDALRYVPGVSFQQSQVNIRASSGYSRGVGSRVLLLIDGVPLLTGDTGEITFEAIPVFQIDRVEVVKGAGSALYGSGALGGVINVLTKEIAGRPEFWWRMYGGAYDEPAYETWKWSNTTRWLNGQAAGYSDTFGDVGIAASVQRLSDDGYREQDWLRRYNAFLKLRYHLSPYQSLTVTSNLFQQYRGDFLWWKDLKNALRPAESQRDIRVSSLRFNTSAAYTHLLSDEFSYQAKVVHFRGNWYRDSLAGKRLDASISDAVVADLQGNLSVTGIGMMTAGITGTFDRVRANIFGDHTANGGALYLQQEYQPTEQWSAVAGLRYDLHQVAGLPSHSQVTPKVGVRYSPAEGHTIRFSAGSGFRAPSIGELYTSTRNTGSAAIIIPSVGLQPERSESYEVSASHTLSASMRMEAALFHSDYDGLIEPQVQEDMALQAVTLNFRNITKARIQGFELSLYTLWFSKTVAANAHYNYNWGVDANTGAFLRFRPRHVASIGLQYSEETYSAGADYRFVSRIEAIDETLVNLAPVTNGGQRVANHIVDLRCSYSFLDAGLPVRATMNINNILGYNYNELIGNMSPPRHIVLSFEGLIQ
ncbi:MAG: TonB-dependent receptor [Bacteroidetes bacterium]|nr:TonB-dependent receptor [Bacteroidota bacterium]